jgi:type II secretory pathway component PulF
VLIFLGRRVLPQFQIIYKDFGTALPNITEALLKLIPLVPWLIGLTLAIFIGLPLVWGLLRTMRLDRAAADLALPLPLIGSVLKRNLIARWIDALKLAVEAGMDLPAAVQLASDVVASPRLNRDSEKIIANISAGKHLDQVNGSLSIIPPTVLAVVQLSADRNDLPEALTTLSTMYQQQAELRLASVQGILTPILIICVAFIIAFVIVALFAPMISLIQTISSPGH